MQQLLPAFPIKKIKINSIFPPRVCGGKIGVYSGNVKQIRSILRESINFDDKFDKSGVRPLKNSFLPNKACAAPVLRDLCFKEVFLFFKVYALAHPREGVRSAKNWIDSNAFKAPVADVADVVKKKRR